MFKKYVALDVGDVRIGVAKSDIMGILATPLEVIDRRKGSKKNRGDTYSGEYKISCNRDTKKLRWNRKKTS